MSSNSKFILLYGASVLLLTASVIMFLHLQLYPDMNQTVPDISTYWEKETIKDITLSETIKDTGWLPPPATAAETDAVEVSESDILLFNEETAAEVVMDQPEILQEKYILQNKESVRLLRIWFPVASILCIAVLILLCILTKREKCAEGIETSLSFITGFIAFIMYKISYCRSLKGIFVASPDGSVNAYGHIGFPDTLLILLFSALFVWGIRTFSSFCMNRSPVSWSLLYRSTEKYSLSQNGLLRMILIPVIAACIFILAAALSAGMRILSGNKEWNIAAWLFLCEVPISIRVLTDRIRSIRTKQQELIEEAKISERMRVDLIANVSHDLRTPLTSIIGYGELLQKEELSGDGRKYLCRLNEKAGYLREMVDEVFDLAKVSSGVMKCRQEKLDLIRLLEQTVGDHEELLQEKHFEIRRDYPEEHLPILSDGVFLHQIFANLISNAVKYTLPGTRIHLQVRTDEENIVIRVINVASYEMKFTEKEILERFARGDVSRNSEGNGLGLAIAKTYTEALSGTFHIIVDGDQFIAAVSLPASVRIS